MAELTEQQQHLQNVVSQQNQLVAEINELGAQADAKRQQAVKLQGIMEYLSELGVTLPEPEAVAEESSERLPSNSCSFGSDASSVSESCASSESEFTSVISSAEAAASFIDCLGVDGTSSLIRTSTRFL